MGFNLFRNNSGDLNLDRYNSKLGNLVPTDKLIQVGIILTIFFVDFGYDRFLLLFPVSSGWIYIPYGIVMFFVSVAFAFTDLDKWLYIWFKYYSTPKTLHLFDELWSVYLPIDHIKNDFIYTTGSLTRGKSIIGGFELLIYEEFAELSDTDRNARIFALENLLRTLLNARVRIIVRPEKINLNPYTKKLERLFQAFKGHIGEQYLLNSQIKYHKTNQKNMNGRNIRSYIFLEKFSNGVAGSSLFANIQSLLSGKTKSLVGSDLIEELEDELERELLLIEDSYARTGIGMKRINDNGLREIFLDFKGENKDSTYNRSVTVSDSFFDDLEEVQK